MFCEHEHDPIKGHKHKNAYFLCAKMCVPHWPGRHLRDIGRTIKGKKARMLTSGPGSYLEFHFQDQAQSLQRNLCPMLCWHLAGSAMCVGAEAWNEGTISMVDDDRGSA